MRNKQLKNSHWIKSYVYSIVYSGTIDMEEMTDIVTTFYSLEGASKGVAIERWA